MVSDVFTNFRENLKVLQELNMMFKLDIPLIENLQTCCLFKTKIEAATQCFLLF